ncbi:choice-of-anchor U domain-containing protein [Candidatus Thiodiazotropha sp. CDECU1]|uniref:choice-of-anchor U domain-containing protein n=1 Tax=Candidatus Thiodiazotropha sp. CDECU1 TaxID=3065865 RepID=UPI002930803F|nr:choice-of-anchor U domain-containing protein [Candidatus Thiodiazotropha sp. CDECU1]
MRKTLWLLLVVLVLHHTQVQSEILDIPLQTPNNFEPFILSSECPDSGIDKFFGAEVVGEEINIYVSIWESGFVAPCYNNRVEIGPIASGSYTINYYTIQDYNTERGLPFELYESQNILIEKISDNEPASGRVTISGEAIEDQVVRASPSLSDRNGMGEIRYHWHRNGQPIPGATSASYMLTDDDIGLDVQCIVSFEDGLGVTESVSSLPVGAPGAITNINDPLVGSVYIRGSVAEGSTLSIDTSSLYDPDGIGELSYYWKRRYRAYSTLDQDIGANDLTYVPTLDDHYFYLSAVVTYTDLHGTRERAESNITGRLVPTTRPIVTPPADMTLAATGALTRVDPGTASAQDDNEGILEPVLDHLVSNGVVTPPPGDGLLDLAPGTHLLIWTADDRDGITGEGIQIVRVDPIIEFGSDLTSSPNGPIGCPLILNGSAARYPVSIPYSLISISSVDGSEAPLQSGTFQIGQSLLESTLSISNTLLGDLSGYTSLRLTMETPSNAVMGEKSSCLIALSDENFAPKVTLTAYQDETASRILSQNGGQVVVRATVQDLNSTDTHTYDWSESDSQLTDLDSDTSSFTFDPADLEPGLYRVSTGVSDGLANDTAVLSLRVVAEAPALSSIDNDGDGETDLEEGSGDSDADGIPDYLDPAGLPGHVLPQESGSNTDYLIQTAAGLALSLGDIAFFAQHHGALISRSDIFGYIANGLGGEADADAYPYEGGLFDFHIEGLSQAGATATVVIPQRQMVASGSVYRKLTSTGWGEFVVDENNLIKSATGEAGICPAPGDSAYTTGLSEGAWCVELTIEDGGPNDADGEANARIADPGGVTTNLSDDSDTGSSSSGGGGGAFNPWAMLLLALVMICTDRLNTYRPARTGH